MELTTNHTDYCANYRDCLGKFKGVSLFLSKLLLKCSDNHAVLSIPLVNRTIQCMESSRKVEIMSEYIVLIININIPTEDPFAYQANLIIENEIP